VLRSISKVVADVRRVVSPGVPSTRRWGFRTRACRDRMLQQPPGPWEGIRAHARPGPAVQGGRPAGVMFYSCSLPHAVIALTGSLPSVLVTAAPLDRVSGRVQGRAAVVDGFRAQSVVAKLVAVDLA
jgi:hypothetical protein